MDNNNQAEEKVAEQNQQAADAVPPVETLPPAALPPVDANPTESTEAGAPADTATGSEPSSEPKDDSCVGEG